MAEAERMKVSVDGRELEVSNLDKVLYPDAGFTKGEIIDYYTRIAPVLLPHLKDRPVTRIRFPNGTDTKGFFEKNAPDHTPRWVRTEVLPSPGSSMGRETVRFIFVDDLPMLVYLANLAALELHVPQWTVNTRGNARPPDLLVIDLDPGPPAGLAECMAVAMRLRDRLADDNITAYPKTSGKKGMQLMCPIAGRQDDDVVSGYAKRIAEELSADDPKRVVSRMAKQLRPGKVFLDWSQNNAAKTTVSSYSLRAQSRPTVSTPLIWDEVEKGKPVTFTAPQVLDRVEEYGDLLAGLRERGPRVPLK